MGLLDFVEQHHGVGLAPYGLGQLSTFVVAHVSGRRSYQTRYAMLLLVFAHVDTGHHGLVVEEELGQCLCQLGLAHAGGTQEEERADGSFGVLQAGTATAHGVGHGRDGFVLADDTLVELFLQMEQFLLLALQHLADGYARPARYDVGYVFSVYFLFYHGVVALHLVQLLLGFLDFLVQRLELAVAYFGHPSVVAFAFGLVGFELQVFDFHLVLLYLVDQRLLALPLGLVGAFLLFQLGQFLAYLLQLGLVVLALDGFALDFELLDFTRNLVELFGHGVDLHTQLGGGLVHQVDGLVGQETVGDVPVAQLDGGYDGIVFDAHVVMVFVAFLQSTQDGDGAQRVGLAHHDRLEASLQGLVFFEVLLVLVQRGGAYAAQLATCQGRLQDVGGVHGAFALAGSYQGVYLVDEEDDVALRLLHLVDDGLQTFLKLAFVLGAGHQRAHVERVELLVLQVFGHVATEDTLGQSFDDGRLTCTRLAYQDGVVLGTAAQNLEHASDFLVTANDRVELAVSGGLDEVDGILLERLIGVFARLRGDLGALPQLADGGAQFLFGHAGVLQYARSGASYGEQGQQDGFQGDELVAQLLGVVHGFLQHLVGLAAQVGFSARYLGQRLNLLVEHEPYLLGVHAQLLEDEVGDVFAHFHDSLQQVYRLDGLLASAANEVHGLLYGFLCLDGKVVKIHIVILLSFFVCLSF